MNKLDLDYQNLLKDILETGIKKETRNGETISVFGRQIRHNMKDGFPLLTTKKMAWKTLVTELIWFLRGDTNIKFLVDNGCHIWDGDAYKNYCKWVDSENKKGSDDANALRKTGKLVKQYYVSKLSQEEFINRIKTDDEFAKKWGELGPVYGKQWREWTKKKMYLSTDGSYEKIFDEMDQTVIDQIANLINDLKTNPDSRRLIVSAWNVGELDKMVLPPCHYGFQVYTRELSEPERVELFNKIHPGKSLNDFSPGGMEVQSLRHQRETRLNRANVPTRAISLMWNQRSVDTFLGLPFNIASYGLLLEIIAKAVNMVPDQLIGNLGDVHLYSNHIEQAKEQIGRELSHSEKVEYARSLYGEEEWWNINDKRVIEILHSNKRTREPFELPTLNINTEWWPTEGGECGVGPLDAVAVFNGFTNDNFCKCLLEEDIQLGNYQSHPTIKAPLSN